MAVSALFFLVFLSFTVHSEADYCICNSGLSDPVLQKNIDYACGSGADCSAIQPNGACYQPNTVKDHCNYAVNSYYQRKGQVADSCNFSNTASTTPNPPSAASGCVYPSSPSNAGSNSSTPSPPFTPGGSPNASGNPLFPPPGSILTPPSGSDFENVAFVTLNRQRTLFMSLLILLLSTLILAWI